LRARFKQGGIRFEIGRAVHISNSPELQRVTLASGRILNARLVVLGCGLNGELPCSLHLRRIFVQKRQSVAAGFTLARRDGSAFPFDAVTYHATNKSTGIDYITLFKIRETMRANIFAFPQAGADWVRQFVQNPDEGLSQCFPKLDRAIGDYRVISKVETSLINLYRTYITRLDGVVLIGDAAQNVCPSTAMGLTKVLTDVDVLCTKCVPDWFRTPRTDSSKISEFYNFPRKRATDAKALHDALYRRQACTGSSIRWRVHRTRLHIEMRFGKAATTAPLTITPKS